MGRRCCRCGAEPSPRTRSARDPSGPSRLPRQCRSSVARPRRGRRCERRSPAGHSGACRHVIERHLHAQEVPHRTVALALQQRAGGLVATVDPVVQHHAGALGGERDVLLRAGFAQAHQGGADPLAEVLRVDVHLGVDADVPAVACGAVAGNGAVRCGHDPGVAVEVDAGPLVVQLLDGVALGLAELGKIGRGGEVVDRLGVIHPEGAHNVSRCKWQAVGNQIHDGLGSIGSGADLAFLFRPGTRITIQAPAGGSQPGSLPDGRAATHSSGLHWRSQSSAWPREFVAVFMEIVISYEARQRGSAQDASAGMSRCS